MPGTGNSGGHNAKSPDQHRRDGTYRSDRHGGFETPEPPQGKPEPPKTLAGEALAEWERMVERLHKAKTLSMVDDAALYQYVLLFAETEAIRVDNVRVRKLSEQLKKVARKLNGFELVETIKKIVDLEYVIAKHSQQLRQGHMALRQYLVEFGMTPSARSRVKKFSDEGKKPSKLLSFRGGKADAVSENA